MSLNCSFCHFRGQGNWISLVSQSILGRSGRFLATRPMVDYLGRPKNDLNRPKPIKWIHEKVCSFFVIWWQFFVKSTELCTYVTLLLSSRNSFSHSVSHKKIFREINLIYENVSFTEFLRKTVYSDILILCDFNNILEHFAIVKKITSNHFHVKILITTFYVKSTYLELTSRNIGKFSVRKKACTRKIGFTLK